MGFGVLGLGSGAASSLNQETIDKLKEAEKKAKIEPLEKKLESWDEENTAFSNIQSLISNFQSAAKNLALSDAHSNIFEGVTASTSGSNSAVFNANDVSGLKPGNIEVHVNALAKAEISTSAGFADKDAIVTKSDGSAIPADAFFTIKIDADGDGTIEDANDGSNDEIREVFKIPINGRTYQEIADDINSSDLFVASIEQVKETGDDKYKLVVKSANTGTVNALEFESTNLKDTIFNVDNSGGATVNFTELQASADFEGEIDGIDYVRASNTIELQGNLTMTATAVDTDEDAGEGIKRTSTILTLERDTGQVIPAAQAFADAYNALQTALSDGISDLKRDENGNISDEKSPFYNKSGLRSILDGIKQKIFGEFGSDSKTLFDYGFKMNENQDGGISVNSKEFADAIKNDYEGIKKFFLGDKGEDGIIGTIDDNAGLGTDIENLLKDYKANDGLVDIFNDERTQRKKNWQKELDKAQKALDARYAQMATQFAEYGAVINQMESAFGGMKMMIEQSTAKQ
jgi:flagellar hook-associated protein 2